MQSLRTSDLYLADDAFLAQSQERTDAIRALRGVERPKQELRQSSNQDYQEHLHAADRTGQQH